MNIASRDRGLTFPFPQPPAPGSMIEVAPGVMWARIALPICVRWRKAALSRSTAS